MVRQLVAGKVFLHRHPLTRSALSSLYIMGEGLQVDNALGGAGWYGADPVISVITSDPISGAVQGVRPRAR